MALTLEDLATVTSSDVDVTLDWKARTYTARLVGLRIARGDGREPAQAQGATIEGARNALALALRGRVLHRAAGDDAFPVPDTLVAGAPPAPAT